MGGDKLVDVAAGIKSSVDAASRSSNAKSRGRRSVTRCASVKGRGRVSGSTKPLRQKVGRGRIYQRSSAQECVGGSPNQWFVIPEWSGEEKLFLVPGGRLQVSRIPHRLFCAEWCMHLPPLAHSSKVISGINVYQGKSSHQCLPISRVALQKCCLH